MIPKLRDLVLANGPNNGSRTLLQSILIPEVEKAFKDWMVATSADPVLIGGIALSFYVKPRSTTDVDLLFLHSSDVPAEVRGFKRTRKLAFQHIQTHVEIEVLDPQAIKCTEQKAHKVFETSVRTDHVIKIASPEGLIALKLGRFNFQDQADIAALLDYLKFPGHLVDLEHWFLSETEYGRLNELKARILKEMPNA